MAGSRLEYLFKKFVSYNCTQAEEEELMQLLSISADEDEVKKLIEEVIENTGSEIQLSDKRTDAILKNIFHPNHKAIETANRNSTISFTLMKVAAVLLLVIAGAFFWNNYNKAHKDNLAVLIDKKDENAFVNENYTVLTMNDGRKIILDSIQGDTVHQGNITLYKKDGILVYNTVQLANSSPVNLINTLSTPRGRQSQIILPDGSKVWLNASSSLIFPSVFSENKREVNLTGEGYFEVAKNTGKSFSVKVEGIEIKVLGTHFNIHAYNDEEALKTSLLEGSIQVVKDNKIDLLKPGQQAVLDRKKDQISIKRVDTEQVLAWKNGLFQFEGADISTIMREIGRWYKMEIIYSGTVPLRKFEGKISRSAELSEVLRILELSNVKFKVEGNKIIVQ